MAIKVRHDGNNAAVIAAGAGSGRAKRRIETAKLAQNTPQHIQTLTPAHASAPGAGGGSAPLTHAPSGASGASAPLTHAPTPTPMGGGAGSRASSVRGGGAGVDLGEVKVTGNSFFTRPDKESQWNPATRRWERPWLPGEKEAEAAQRMNPVLAEREQFRQGLRNDAAEAAGARELDMLRAKAGFAQEAADAEAARRQREWDRQHGILRQERDADLIAAGTHEYGYSPEVQREYDRLQREYDEGLQKGRYIAGSDDERRFMEDMERKIAALPKTLVQRKDPEGLFRNNTFTDEQGRIFTTDGKLMYNPADAETRRMEFQQKQMDAMRSAADKLYTELKKPRKITRMVDDGDGETKPEAMFEERSDDEVLRIMQERYPQLFPAPPSQPGLWGQFKEWVQGMVPQPSAQAQTPQPTQPTPTEQQPQQAQPVVRADSQGVNWEIVFDANGKPIGKRRVRQ